MRVITVDSMVRVVFTGDSQTTGRNLAIDYPQLLSRVLPVRVFNTAVGGSNSDALVRPMTGGTARLVKGEHILHGTDVRWGMGPFPGMKVSVADETYTIDSLVEHPPTLNSELLLVEPARRDYEGAAVTVEPGWEVRVARQRPAVVCLMFINDGAMSPARLENWREMLRRIRGMGAVPVLMSPFPVDELARGGNHPGFNDKVLLNAAAVRDLAATEQAWFIDVAALTLALDPPLRSQIRDGIHPDTDGQTAAINGLLWVFAQMGLTTARPFIKGWVLNGPPAPLADLLAGGTRPFRTSQPDHPDPDHQSEQGFTLAAIRRNDEYGRISTTDAEALPLGHGVLLRIGLEPDSHPQALTLRLTGSGLAAPQAWDPQRQAWTALASPEQAGARIAAVPPDLLQDGILNVLVTGSADAALDAVALEVEEAGTPKPWRPSARQPTAYELTSDHADPDNRVRNAAFAAGSPGQADGWTLTAGAAVNRPFTADAASVSFEEADNLRVARVRSSPTPRPYDVLVLSGSQAGNDGPYRIAADLGEGRFRLRKPAKVGEAAVQGQLFHDDGCGLVPGGCCVEVAPGARAETTVVLDATTERLSLSLFARVYAPGAMGTRDVPGCRNGLVEITFYDRAKGTVGRAWHSALPADSYQWQKLTESVTVPSGAATARLSLAAAGHLTMQFTGVFMAPQPRR